MHQWCIKSIFQGGASPRKRVKDDNVTDPDVCCVSFVREHTTHHLTLGPTVNKKLNLHHSTLPQM